MKKIAFSLSFIITISTFMFLFSAISAVATDASSLDVLNKEAHDECLWEALFGSSTDSSVDEYDNFLSSYYDNLTYNFGVNYKGSCGYIAIAMLLSYYDTYLNDRIIPDQYDILSSGNETNMIDRHNSPGVSRDLIVNPNNTEDSFDYALGLTAEEYYSYMESIQNSSLQAKLITIGATSGYYNFSNDDLPAGTKFNERYSVLISYLNNVADISIDQYEISYLNYEDDESKSDLVKQHAINHVKAGRPVLLSARGNKGGHVVVAYDYNETTGDLYCHMGWGANKTYVTLESENFFIYRSSLAIDFNIEHSHPLNYAVTIISNNIPITKYYCYNDCEIITYSENSTDVEHNCIYEYRSSEQHLIKCGCGSEYILQSHNLIYSYYSPTQHYKSCDDCIYFGPENHRYTPHEALSSGGHSCVCVCGEIKTEAHYEHTYTSKNFAQHYIYCECGYLIGTETHTMRLSGEYNVCQDCGYSVKTSGGVTLDKIEEQTENQ